MRFSTVQASTANKRQPQAAIVQAFHRFPRCVKRFLALLSPDEGTHFNQNWCGCSMLEQHEVTVRAWPFLAFWIEAT